MVSVIKIERKKRTILVKQVRIDELNIKQCSRKFVSHNLPTNMLVYIKCDQDGNFDLRGKRKEYRIIVPDKL